MYVVKCLSDPQHISYSEFRWLISFSSASPSMDWINFIFSFKDAQYCFPKLIILKRQRVAILDKCVNLSSISTTQGTWLS